jgi:hypothetical protein
VKLLDIDKMGRLNLSYIDAIDPDGAPPPEERPLRGSGMGGGGSYDRGGSGGGYDRPPPRRDGGGYDRPPPRRDGGYNDRGGSGGSRDGGNRPRYR